MAKAVVIAGSRGAPETAGQMIQRRLDLLEDQGKRDGFEIIDSDRCRHTIGVQLYNRCAIQASDIPPAKLIIRDSL